MTKTIFFGDHSSVLFFSPKVIFGGNVKKKRKEYLLLFGLGESYTSEELTRTYHALAKLNHPDRSDDPDARMRMILINEGYSFLQECAGVKQESAEPGEKNDVFVLYQEAIELVAKSFDEYYDTGHDNDAFVANLKAAKAKFSVIVKDYPKSPWYFDAIDRICSINKWL